MFLILSILTCGFMAKGAGPEGAQGYKDILCHMSQEYMGRERETMFETDEARNKYV